MATPIWQWSAVDTAAAIRDGRATSEEVVQAHIDRMHAANPAINAIVVDLGAQAIEAARAADRALAQGSTPGKLQGVPVTVKINIDVEGQANSNGVVAFKRGVICEPDFLSGASALRRTIEALERGDVLMVTRLDRLARSTRDLLNTLTAITQERQASAR